MANSNQNDEKYIEELDKYLDKFRNEIKPRVSFDNIIDFCFVLNRISYYLSYLERSLQDKNFEILQKMSRLRRKLDVALLEHRFKFSQMESSLLDIKIDRFKFLTNNENLKSIFLEKEETKKFIVSIEDALGRKASNLQKNKTYNTLSWNDIRELAVTIDINSLDDIINTLDEKKNIIEEKEKQKQKDIFLSFIKLGFKIVDDVYLKGVVNNVLKIEKDGKQIELKSSDIEKFIYSEKELTKKETNENKNENEKPKENEKTDENEKPKENENENKKDEIDENRKLNYQSLGMGNENISNQYLEEITKGLENYLEIQKMKKKIESIENQKKKLQSRKDYNSDFINLLKLYNQLARRNYQNRDDFYGVIIEEKKVVDNLKKNEKEISEEQIDLREYIIYEINNENDEINEIIYNF